MICLGSRESDHSICKDLNIKKRVAVDTRTKRKAINRLRKGSYILHPRCVHACDYFSVSPGAVGCFLSHVKLWREVSSRKPGRFLILEDDALRPDVEKLISATSVNMIGQQDDNTLTQLNKRIVTPGMFVGTESYCLTPVVASKLIHIFENPGVLTDNKVIDPISGHVIECINLHSKPVIWTAVDRFIQACSSSLLPDEIRINISSKRRIGLTKSISTVTEKQPHLLTKDELDSLRDAADYKWW